MLSPLSHKTKTPTNMTKFSVKIASRMNVRRRVANQIQFGLWGSRIVRVVRLPATTAVTTAMTRAVMAMTALTIRTPSGGAGVFDGPRHLVRADSDSVDTVTYDEEEQAGGEDNNARASGGPSRSSVVSPYDLSPQVTPPRIAVATPERTVGAPARLTHVIPDFGNSPDAPVLTPLALLRVGGPFMPVRVQLAANGVPDRAARQLVYPDEPDLPVAQLNNMEQNLRRAFEPLSNFQRGRLANRLASPTNSPPSSPRNNNNFFPSDF